MKRKSKDQEINKAAEKIMNIIEGDKNEIKAHAVVSGANLNPQNSKLKIKSMVVEGENGTYTVCENGVELRNEGIVMFFENPEQLYNFTKEYKEVFSMF